MSVEIDTGLFIGSGGREFRAMQDAQASGAFGRILSTRGEDAVNRGIEGVINTGVGDKDVDAITAMAVDEGVQFAYVGPEAPLIRGVADRLRAEGVLVYGPGADGAEFEKNKCVTDAFVRAHGLPNPPGSEPFGPDELPRAKSFIADRGVENVVTKRVGEEGGKGAKLWRPDQLGEAFQEGEAVAAKGEGWLIQPRLTGPEYSAMFMLDGRGNVVAKLLARDHKALHDLNLGIEPNPNTGGMGAFSPLTMEQAPLALRRKIEWIGQTAAGGLVEDGIDYRGTLYAGLMQETADPESPLSIIEFNVRDGDPEAQVQSLGSKTVELWLAAAGGHLETDMSRLYVDPDSHEVTMTVCLASPGYSQDGQKVVTDLPIHVPGSLPENVTIQYAGAVEVDGELRSSGGRVLYVTMTAPSIAEARNVYNYIGRENGGVYLGNDQQLVRSDIGLV